MIAAEIALAFNNANERKSWVARPNSRSASGTETVHFAAATNLITLVYHCDTERFEVRFNKFHASWGDYVKAIARSLHVVLSTLKAAGLPFDAPETYEGIEVVTTASNDATTFVRWPGQTPKRVGLYEGGFDPGLSWTSIGDLTIRTMNMSGAIMPEQDREAVEEEIEKIVSDTQNSI